MSDEDESWETVAPAEDNAPVAAPAPEPEPPAETPVEAPVEPPAEPAAAPEEPVVVNTALHPDEWPKSESVTDPEILKEHGMPVPEETPAEPEAPAVEAAAEPEVVPEGAQRFVCYVKQAPSSCPPFWAVVGDGQVACPNCGSTTVLQDEAVPSA